MKINKYLLTFALLSNVVCAQVIPGAEAPLLKTMSAVDSHGVELISGEALIPGVNMSIGGQQGGISISDNSFNGMRMQYKGAIVYFETTAAKWGCESLPAGQYFSVSTGKDTNVFKYVSGADSQLIRGKGSLQLATATNFIYRDLDGAEYQYENFSIGEGYVAHLSDSASGCNFQKPIATLTKITKPNGEVIDIVYEKGPVITLPFFGDIQQGYFTSVRSSLGWMFKRELVSESGDVATSSGKTIKTESIFANLSEEYCNPESTVSCRGVSKPWSRFKLDENYSVVGAESTYQTVSYTGNLENPLGKKSKLAYSFTESANPYDTVYTSAAGLVKKYKKYCSDVLRCAGSNNRVDTYTQGTSSFNYGVTALATSDYADQYLAPRDAWGPDGKVRYSPALSQFPTHFYDNLARDYEQNYQPESLLLEQVGYASDTKTKAGYDARGNMTSVTQLPKAAGNTPLVTTLHYPDGSTCTTAPKTCNKPDTITDASGVVTTYTYHAQSGYVETITKPAVNGVSAQTKYTYEQKTPYVKNSSGGLVANPLVWVLTEVSSCMTQTLNTCVSTKDEKRIVYSDFTNNLLPKKMTIKNGIDSLHLETVTDYDLYGNIVSVDGPRPGTYDKVYYFYDLMRHKVGEIGADPDGAGPLPRQATKTTYSDDGNVVSIKTGLAYGTTQANLDSMVVKQESAVEYSTDHGLPVVERSYAAGTLERVTQKSYDTRLRLGCVAQRLNRDAWSSLPASACTLGTAGAEGNDRITKYNYDAADAVTSVVSAFGAPRARADRVNTYDPINALLKTEADGKGNTTFYKYDDFNRLSKTVYPKPDDGTAESSTDYTQTNYKSGSQLVESVRLRDGLIVEFSKYDALGRVETKSNAVSEAFKYNNFNQVVSHKYNSTGGVSATSTFDFNALGWLNSESREAGGVSLGLVGYLYDDYGRRTRLTWPDAFYVAYDYTVNNYAGDYLQAIKQSDDATLATFVYDDLARRFSVTRGNGVVTSYGYDDLSRIQTLATDVSGTADDISETFGYTNSGQIKSRTFNVTNKNYIYAPIASGTTSYAPNSLNQITTITTGSAASLEYDNRGNLTTDNTTGTTFTYNADNLLLNSTKANVTTTLSYDAEKRLYSIVKPGSSIKFAYDGNKLISESDASNNILRRYVPGPGTDEPIVWFEGAGTTDKRYPTVDRQGSVIGMTVSGGTNSFINAYDEYGVPKATNQGRYQYTGQTWIPELGLYYYKARFYNPALGRFMQADPIGYKDGMNWYAYVGNDPINLSDSTGQCIEDLCIGEIAVAAAVIEETGVVAAVAEGATVLAEGATVLAGEASVAFSEGMAISAAESASAAAIESGATSGATTGLVTAEGEVFTGASTGAGGPGMATNSEVAAAVAEAPQGPFAGCCGEINAMSKALNAGAKLEGAIMATVRATGRQAGKLMEACPTCKAVANQLGVKTVSPK